MINITNSIPSGITSDLGHSTLIVRVLDQSSSTQNDSTYFVLVGLNNNIIILVHRQICVNHALSEVEGSMRVNH